MSINEDQRATLRLHLYETGLMPIAEEMVADARSAVHLLPTGPAPAGEVGLTRVGGVPDLPFELDWPLNNHRYMVFVAQINLRDIPPAMQSPLPPQGMLYFFHGRAEPGTNIPHSVLYYDGPTGRLVAEKRPDLHEMDEDPDFAFYPPYGMQARTVISLPHYGSLQAETYEALMSARAHIDGDEFFERYLALMDALRGFNVADDSELSQLWGYPQASSHPPEEDAESYKGSSDLQDEIAMRAESLKWRLLFELGSHTSANMAWGDGGFLQFFIHSDDINARNFDHTYAGIMTV